MDNNKMVKYKEGFIYKIKKFFKVIFGKEEQKDNNIKKEYKNSEIEDIQDSKRDFVNDIKIDSKLTDSVIEKKDFLKKIDGNEKALNMLSIDRLKKLEEYYNTIIEHNNQEIKRLKGSV